MLRITATSLQFLSFWIGLKLIWSSFAYFSNEASRVAFIALLCLLMLTYASLCSDPFSIFHDFKIAYYPAGAAVIDGPSSLFPLFKGVHGFVNLPIVAYLFYPFALIPFWPSAIAFTAVGAIMSIYAWLLIKRNAGLTDLNAYYLLFIFSAFGPLIYSLKVGNTSHMVMLGLVYIILFLEEKRYAVAGILMAFLSIIKLPLLIFGLYFLINRMWSALGAFMLSLAVAIAASLIVFGAEIHVKWLQDCILNANKNYIGAFNAQSVAAFAVRLGATEAALGDWNGAPPGILQKTVSNAIALAILLASLAVCMRGKVFTFEQFPLKWTPVERRNCDQNKELEPRSDSIGSEQALAASESFSEKLKLEFFIFLILAAILSPLSWSHYYVWLLIPFAYVLQPKQPDLNRAVHTAKWLSLALMMPLVYRYFFANETLSAIYTKLLSSHLLAGGLLLLGVMVYLRWQADAPSGEPVQPGRAIANAAG